MKLLIVVVLAFVAAIHAEDVVKDTSVDWSQVKHFLPKIPVPFELQGETIKERIVGGWESEPNGIPYMAAILVTVADGVYLCGGSIISERDILTSAFCLQAASQVQVILGAHRLDIIESTQQRFFSSEFYIHHGFNYELYINDIALIRLPSDIEINEYVSIVTVPTFDDAVNDFAGETARLSGWGLVSDDAVTPSEVLKLVYGEILTNFVCNFSLLGLIQDTHICTTGEGPIGACGGDGGGPLVLDNKQVGVISYGVGLGCEAQWPTVFTRVTSYLDWLEANSDAHIA